MEEKVIIDAEFNESVTTYWLANGALVCVVTGIGILFLPIWYFVGKYFTKKYLDSHKCTLTNRNLKVSKGIFTKVEKTVPLDRITDLGVVQGPLMRYFDIEALSVETAGQSGMGSLVQLQGIKGGRDFRDAVLRQRDLVVGSKEDGGTVASTSSLAANTSTTQLLTEIRDSLVRLESKFENRN